MIRNTNHILACVVVTVLLVGVKEQTIATGRGTVPDTFVEGYQSAIEGQKDVLKTRIVAVFMIIETLPTVEQDAAIEDFVQRIMKHFKTVIQATYLEGITTGYEEAIADYQPEIIKGLIDAYIAHQRHLGRIVDPYAIKILEAQDMNAFRNYIAENVAAANGTAQLVVHASTGNLRRHFDAFKSPLRASET